LLALPEHRFPWNLLLSDVPTVHSLHAIRDPEIVDYSSKVLLVKLAVPPT
jgi:hypothetical protein